MYHKYKRRPPMNKAIIIYDTRTRNTEIMAQNILAGLKESGIQAVSKLYKGNANVNELMDYDAIIVGSPTVYHNIDELIKQLLVEMGKMDLRQKIGAAFGSHGWSGEAVQLISSVLRNDLKMDVIEPGLLIKYAPDTAGLAECRKFGKKIAEKIKSGPK
jgi:flavorubredoxin